MRNIAVVAPSCVFAVGVAGQQQPAERPVELAGAFVALEQEHDLDKAVRLFAAAMDDAALGTGVREAAAANLYGSLLRLGRKEEAVAAYFKALAAGLNLKVAQVTDGAQDPEREKELQEKARELLAQLATPPTQINGNDPYSVPRALSDQLLWIGPPAVPEIIVKLQQLKEDDTSWWPTRSGLLGLLWTLRGAPADAFLQGAAAGRNAKAAAEQAFHTEAIDVDSSLFRAYLEHPDPEVTRAFLLSRNLIFRIEPSKVVELAERGSETTRVIVLEWFARRDFDIALLPRLHELARRGLASTDPAWGKAAEQFLCGSSSQRSIEGLKLLLGRLPELRGQQLQMGALPWGWYGDYQRFSAADVQQLLPAIEACVARFPSRALEASKDAATRHLEALLQVVVRAGDDDTVRKALGWWDKGFDMLDALGGRVNSSTAVEVFARRRLVAAEHIHQFIRLFQFEGPLPGELYEPIAAMAGELQVNHLDDLARMLVRTGDERVVGWMLEQWQKDRAGERIITRSGGNTMSSVVGDKDVSDLSHRLAWQMMTFARSNRGEQVRDGMLRMLQGAGPRRADDQTRARLLMAALTLGGEAALQCFATDCGRSNTFKVGYHPFLSSETGKSQSPLEYLVMSGQQPPHGYADEQVFAAVQQLVRQRPEGGLLDPGSIDVASVSERLVALFAANDPSRYDRRDWQDVAVAELSRRMAIGDPTPALERWFGEQLAARDGSDALLVPCYPNVVERFREQLAAVLTGDEARWAYRAAQLLWQVDRGVDITAALQNRHGLVRQWAVKQVVAGDVEVPLALLLPLLADSDEDVREELARHFGAIVSKEAVPELIGLLRDPVDSVRTAAAEALTRIRFYHEQQAHWDRVNKGMDASPASACEKLLLQAKPGQPAAQRLLAIESLGTLGVPEALPFLIDWTTDPDEAVAKAARAAITAIHLQPRR